MSRTLTRFGLDHLKHLRARAKDDFHKYNGHHGGDFESYWQMKIIERMDVMIPFAGYWDAVKLIQQVAWEEERRDAAEGL